MRDPKRRDNQAKHRPIKIARFGLKEKTGERALIIDALDDMSHPLARHVRGVESWNPPTFTPT